MAQEEICVKGNVRKLQQQANGSTTVALPAELVRALRWKDKQKVVVKKRGETLVIRDGRKAN
jgi:antitoxin component of MazEF toxin-antitoxin module